MIKVATRLIGQAPGVPPGYINAKWIYDREDPAAVILTLLPPNSEEDNVDYNWYFSRELLAEALNNPRQLFGFHDVRLIVLGPRIVIEFDNGESKIKLIGLTDDAKVFLHKTYQEVTIQQEQHIVDTAIETFLNEVSTHE